MTDYFSQCVLSHVIIQMSILKNLEPSETELFAHFCQVCLTVERKLKWCFNAYLLSENIMDFKDPEVGGKSIADLVLLLYFKFNVLMQTSFFFPTTFPSSYFSTWNVLWNGLILPPPEKIWLKNGGKVQGTNNYYQCIFKCYDHWCVWNIFLKIFERLRFQEKIKNVWSFLGLRRDVI